MTLPNKKGYIVPKTKIKTPPQNFPQQEFQQQNQNVPINLNENEFKQSSKKSSINRAP